jgi:hypothetical protein
MKKAAMIAGAVLFLFTAIANAQTDTLPAKQPDPVTDTVPIQQPTEPAVQSTEPTQPTQTEQPATEQPAQPAKKDQWNNADPEKYKLLPMPEALTTEKIFPVIGKYTLTDKDGATTEATVTLDESNKGIVWVEGLPQGKIKAYLRKSPGIYKIPVQKLDEGEVAVETEETDAKTAKASKKAKAEKAAKELPEGVLIFDKDNNMLDVCIGCPYNAEDPAVAFAAPAEPEMEVTEETVKAKKATAKTKAKKVKPVQTWKYSGNKVVEETTAITPAQQ